MKIKTTYIDYSIEPEDCIDAIPKDWAIDDPREDALLDAEVERLKKVLPQELVFEIAEEDWEECSIADLISDETGWLVESLGFEVCEAEEVSNV